MRNIQQISGSFHQGNDGKALDTESGTEGGEIFARGSGYSDAGGGDLENFCEGLFQFGGDWVNFGRFTLDH